MSEVHVADCPNCGQPLKHEPPGRYCPACGQETTLHPPSVFEFVHEFIGHYVALEGKLWKTLALLMLHPGRLTSEYLAGRRRRYVPPLRLYLSVSFVFFVLVNVVSPAAAPQNLDIGKVEVIASARTALLCDAHGVACDALNRWFGPAARHWRDHPQQAQLELRRRYAASVPYAIFALLPLFAALVQLAYRNRRMLYGEHLVFSLHMHAFCFIALLAVEWLPSPLDGIVLLAVPLYGLWALRRVYGGSWIPTVLRALFIASSYGLLLALVTAAGVAYLVATAT